MKPMDKSIALTIMLFAAGQAVCMQQIKDIQKLQDLLKARNDKPSSEIKMRKKANLQGMDLSHADLKGSSLKEADLRDANLSDADLRNANLSVADLKNANLTRAKVTGTNFTAADVRGAKLVDVDLSAAKVSGAFFNKEDLTESQKAALTKKGAIIGSSERPEVKPISRSKISRDYGEYGMTEQEGEFPKRTSQDVTTKPGDPYARFRFPED